MQPMTRRPARVGQANRRNTDGIVEKSNSRFNSGLPHKLLNLRIALTGRDDFVHRRAPGVERHSCGTGLLEELPSPQS
jgi:hypothetical protein